ncbi:MAG TPA: TonB-dependent receptor [Proteobacteria bacterium]|mgnify:CR=1 FL=1|nr:TonB-dependent receptor [Pseudomonadota bacterium]
MLGVINLITRKGEPDRLGLDAKTGSHRLQRYNLEGAIRDGGLAAWGNLNYLNSDGAGVRVKRDALSDDPLNAGVSLAPGSTREWVERGDINGGFAIDDLQLQLQYLDHRDGGFFGPGKALSDETEMERSYFWSELSWKKSFFDGTLQVRPRISFDRHVLDSKLGLRPPGFTGPQGEVFPDGKLEIQSGVVRALTANLQFDWQLGADHLFSCGGEFRYTVLDQVSFRANFDPLPLPELIDVTDHFSWMAEARRRFYSVYAQDQWRLNAQLFLVAGLRFDHYQDFGSEVSPRLALVYQPRPWFRIKAAYGESFAAPSFRSLYKQAQGGPFLGNPELDAETGRCYELDFEFELGRDLDLSLALYRNEFEDLIREETNRVTAGKIMFANEDEVVTHGVEFGLVRRFSGFLEGGDLRFNLAYAHARDQDGEPLAGISRWLSLAALNFRLWPGLNLNLTCQYVGRTERVARVACAGFPDYLLADVTLRAVNHALLPPGVEVFVAAHNLFSEDYAYACTSGELPDGYPRPGVSFEVGCRVKF